MRIAIITSGILPVPAVLGGAVENLIDYYLEYNEQHRLHDITLYSAWHPGVKDHIALQSNINHFKYIKTHTLWFRLCAKVFGLIHSNCYYFYQLELPSNYHRNAKYQSSATYIQTLSIKTLNIKKLLFMPLTNFLLFRIILKKR